MNESRVAPSTQQAMQIPIVNEQHPIARTMVQNLFKDNHFVYHVDSFQNGDQEQTNEVDEVKEKYQILEKRWMAVDESDILGFDTMNLSLVSDLTIPAKFKIFEFETYKGHTCP